MTRLLKTTNKQFAEEKAARMRDYIKAVKSTDSIEVREFKDGAGQIIYEVWLQHWPDKEVTHA